MTHMQRIRWAGGPEVSPARDTALRFLVSGLAVIRDQMGASVLDVGSRTLFDQTL